MQPYLEGTLSELSSLLLELLDGTRVDTTTLVDQVSYYDESVTLFDGCREGAMVWWKLTGGGGLAGIDVADNDDVNVSAVVLTVVEVSDCSMEESRELVVPVHHRDGWRMRRGDESNVPHGEGYEE